MHTFDQHITSASQIFKLISLLTLTKFLQNIYKIIDKSLHLPFSTNISLYIIALRPLDYMFSYASECKQLSRRYIATA